MRYNFFPVMRRWNSRLAPPSCLLFAVSLALAGECRGQGPGSPPPPPPTPTSPIINITTPQSLLFPNTPYDVYIDGVYPFGNPGGTEASLGYRLTQVWNITFVDSGYEAWDDFRVKIVTNTGYIDLQLDYVTALSGFTGGPNKPTYNFALMDSNSQAYLSQSVGIPPLAGAVVHSGKNLKLTLEVYNASGLQNYHLEVTPSAVPEPSSLVMLVTGGLGILGYCLRIKKSRTRGNRDHAGA